MPGVIRTSLRDIAPLITTRLAAATSINRERIFWIARLNPVPHFTGQADILLRPRRKLALQDNVDGGGKWDTRVTRILDVIPRVQYAVDPAASDYEWLFASGGYITLEEEIVDALQMFMPTDSTGNILVAEPMRLVTADDPLKEAGNEVVWGSGVLGFEMVYTMDLDTTGE
jgi:hypothetical protein